MRHISLLFLIITSQWLSSCVTVKLGGTTERSKILGLAEPSAPFREVQLSGVDRAWKSLTTGNTISYFSECGGAALPLEKVRDEILLSLTEAKIITTEMITHDDREALVSKIEGKSEGIVLGIEALIYQKNGCRYTLTLSGRRAELSAESQVFNRFKKEFKAP